MNPRHRPAIACVLIATWAGALGAGCTGRAADRQRLRSANPLERAEATVRLAEAGDQEATHKLVDLLDDPDRAVRMYAILALRRPGPAADAAPRDR